MMVTYAYNPYTINVHCDGAMDYDKNQTGGNGFFIEFPESIGMEPIYRSCRNDGQGIHRLEMISIAEAINELINLDKRNPGLLSKSSGVRIYTDRFYATDETQLNPFRIATYKKNHWENDEGKPIKNKEILDKISTLRKKLSNVVKGSVEINYHKEKRNKTADKLSKKGKRGILPGNLSFKKKSVKISPRKFSGPEINYSALTQGETLNVRVYKAELVGDEYEVGAEIIDGIFSGMTIKIYINKDIRSKIHRQHNYKIIIGSPYRHHILISHFEEIIQDDLEDMPKDL